MSGDQLLCRRNGGIEREINRMRHKEPPISQEELASRNVVNFQAHVMNRGPIHKADGHIKNMFGGHSCSA